MQLAPEAHVFAQFRRAVMWAGLAALVGTLVWAANLATIAPVLEGDNLEMLATLFVPRLWTASMFGGFVALLAALPYLFIFMGWQSLVRRKPQLERTRIRLTLSCLLLSLPLVAVVL